MRAFSFQLPRFMASYKVRPASNSRFKTVIDIISIISSESVWKPRFRTDSKFWALLAPRLGS